MSVEIKIEIHCDVCGKADDAATTLIYRTSDQEGAREYRLDVCPIDRQITIDQLLKHGKRWTAPDDDAPPLTMRGRKRESCQWCAQVYSAGSGMSLHVKNKHPEHWVSKRQERQVIS